jgi:hypothetical protein
MKIKTNLRAGSGGVDNTTTVDTSNQKQNQTGKGGTATVVYYYPPVSRCVGL